MLFFTEDACVYKGKTEWRAGPSTGWLDINPAQVYFWKTKDKNCDIVTNGYYIETYPPWTPRTILNIMISRPSSNCGFCAVNTHNRYLDLSFFSVLSDYSKRWRLVAWFLDHELHPGAILEFVDRNKGRMEVSDHTLCYLLSPQYGLFSGNQVKRLCQTSCEPSYQSK